MDNGATTSVGLGSTTAAPAAKVKKERGTVTADKDLTACAKISKIVNELDAADTKTVVDWFNKKFGAK